MPGILFPFPVKSRRRVHVKKISALVVFILSPLSVWANEEITVPLPSREFIEMVRIEAGTFLMGTPTELVEEWRSYNEHQEEMKPTSFINIPISDEDPQHQVTISKSFYLGKYEVSRNQWFAILNPDQRKVYQGISMSGISWNEIQDYIALLNEQTGLSFRLPTEAEWEYSARAGTTTLWWTGDDTSEADRTIKNSYTSNPWGLVKILGGVMELTSDGKRKYKDQHEIDPVGPDPRMESVSRAVMRGGDDEGYAHVTGWMGSYPYYARCAYRMAEYIDRGNRFWIGFRLLLEEDSVTNVRGDESWGKIKKKATTSGSW